MTHEIRKAVPPRGLAGPARIQDETLEVLVNFDPSNGRPLIAFLLTVDLHEGRWRPRGVDGVPLVEGVDYTITSVEHNRRSDCLVDVALDWPSGARSVVLMLTHEQIRDVGDRTHGWSQTVELASVSANLLSLGLTPLPLRPRRPPTAQARIAKTIMMSCMLELDSGDLDRGVLMRRPPVPRRPESAGLRFALASCSYPAGIIDGGVRAQVLAHTWRDFGPAERSLERLSEKMLVDPEIRFVVLAGDQVYVDATAGLFDVGTLLDQFTFAYDRMFANKGLQRLFRVVDTEVVTIMDDHEIVDNWEPLPFAPPDYIEKMLEPACKEYMKRQRPICVREPRRSWLWCEDEYHGYEFFFADTRTEREGRRVANVRKANIMSLVQLTALTGWIAARAPEPRPAFIVSSSILLPRRLLLGRDGVAMALHCDSWCGYPHSLYSVLASACDSNSTHLVFLSGDEHLSCVAEIDVCCDESGREVTIVSVHSSALYAPYPFANSVEADFPEHDRFEFDCSGRHYHCTVRTRFPSLGDGFAILSTRPEGGRWKLDVAYDRDGRTDTISAMLG